MSSSDDLSAMDVRNEHPVADTFKGVIDALIINNTEAPLKETPIFDVMVVLTTGETKVAQNLTLTVWPIKEDSTIQWVHPGIYPQQPNVDGSITISFGDLYSHESRKVIVTLKLPAVTSKDEDDENDEEGIRGVIVFKCNYNYRGSVEGQVLEGTPLTAAITRTAKALPLVSSF